MVVRVVDQPVVGKHDALAVSVLAVKVNVAFGPLAALLVGEQALVIAEAVAADGAAVGDLPEVALAADPAQCLRFLLGQVVVRKLVKGIQIHGDELHGVIPAVFLYGELNAVDLDGLAQAGDGCEDQKQGKKQSCKKASDHAAASSHHMVLIIIP